MEPFAPPFIEGIILEWLEYTKKLIEKCREAGKPSSASFELTPLCNFNCNMCYIHLSPEQAKAQGKLLTTEQWLHIAEESKKLGTIALEVTGGEAVTRPDFSVLYEAFIKMGFLVSLRTNGYLLSGDILELLRKYKPKSISVTLYGGSNETYHRVCGVHDGFSVVTRNILALRDAGIEPKLTVTMTKENLEDRSKLKEWANNNAFHITFFGGLITPIRSAKRSIEHLKVEYGADDLSVENDIPSREVQDREKYMSPFSMCREYGTRFCISWDGRMTLCNTLPSIWTDPLSNSLGDAFAELYKQLRMVKRPAECEECQYIDYCGACPARFFSDTGSHDKVSLNMCRAAKLNYQMALSKHVNVADINKEKQIAFIGEGNKLNED